jgi:hypothetical protein
LNASRQGAHKRALIAAWYGALWARCRAESFPPSPLHAVAPELLPRDDRTDEEYAAHLEQLDREFDAIAAHAKEGK